MASKRVLLRIRGRVQGVYYRESARKQAEHLFIRGWVQNLPDGDVAAVAEGTQVAVDAFIEWCRRGPPMAEVSEVLVTPDPDASELQGFSVRR